MSRIATLLTQASLLALCLTSPWLMAGSSRPCGWASGRRDPCDRLWLIKLLTDRPAFLPVACLPLALLIGLGLLQIVPLDAKTGGLLSPYGTRFRCRTARTPRGPGRLESAAAQRQPASLYPASTRYDLAMLVLATASSCWAQACSERRDRDMWLCALLAVNGAALAFFGFVQQLTWKGLWYWKIPLLAGGAPFGPFVCRNNAGGFLNLCLAGAAGMMIWLAGRHGSSGPGGEQFGVHAAERAAGKESGSGCGSSSCIGTPPTLWP